MALPLLCVFVFAKVLTNRHTPDEIAYPSMGSAARLTSQRIVTNPRSVIEQGSVKMNGLAVGRP